MDEATPVDVHLESTIKTGDGRRRRGHMAELLETWMVRVMGVGAAVLLVFLLYSFMKTGSGVPSWMH